MVVLMLHGGYFLLALPFCTIFVRNVGWSNILAVALCFSSQRSRLIRLVFG